MKTDANWRWKLGQGMLGLSLAFAVASCGGGGTADLSSNTSTAPAGSGSEHAVVITSKDDIAKLPEAQQRLFTDPGWNQPYIEPEQGVTGLPAPSTEELLRLTQERLEQGDDVLPRGVVAPASGDSKSASWFQQGSAAFGNVNPPYGGANNVPDYNGVDNVLKGEYYNCLRLGIPPYGCNADGANQGNRTPANAIEDTIAQFNVAALGGANVPISYVLEGLSGANWFNTGGAGGGNPRCAIFQVFSSQKTAIAANYETNKTALFGEVSFRSDLTQYKKGPGQGLQPDGTPGGNLCYVGAPVAQGVSGHFWRAFNRENTAMPNGSPVRFFDILIAPAAAPLGVGSTHADYLSADASRVEYQQFYFGSVSNCYGGAYIFGISSSESTCQAFKDILTSSPGFFHNPIYGVVLKKWQQMAPASEPGRPWKGQLGAPVFGPVAYKSGAATSEATRKWYAWGWYFERGFMWYVDNDQVLFPNAADEAQLYLYSGSNTYCPGGTYTQITPSTFYLGPNVNTFRVNVAINGYSGDDTVYAAPTFNSAPGVQRYQVPLTSVSPTDEQVWIAASASGYGGTPDANCQYASYVWAWRDGTVEGPFAGVAGESRKHLYAGAKPGAVPSSNKQSIYVIRVQCVDSAGAIAYGDSLPVELGTGGGAGGGGDVLLVRNDGGSYNVNYNAIKADLDAIVAANPNFSYSETTYTSGGAGFVTAAKAAKVVIWYRGGPEGTGGTNQTTAYTAQQLADMVAIMASPTPRPILHFSQNIALSSTNFWYVNGLNWEMLAPLVTPSLGEPPASQTAFFNISGNNPMMLDAGVPISGRRGPNFGGGSPPSLTLPAGAPNSGERYSGTGSSGPGLTGFAAPAMVNHQVSLYGPVADIIPNAGTALGLGCNSDAVYSWGNSTTGVKNWMVTYPWSPIVPIGRTRSQVLLNIIAWLDNSVGSAPSGGGGFTSYNGAAQILTVTPVQFRSNGSFNLGNTSTTGVTYPDATAVAGRSADVLRSTALPALPGAVLTTVAGNDGINGNDAQFAASLYAYITDPNGSILATNTRSGDETVVFGGLMLANNGGNSWTRVNPSTQPGYQSFQQLFNIAPFNTRLPVAGYYVSTTADFTAPFTRAFYGGAPADISFDNAEGPVTYECVAHWDASTVTYGASAATVRWSLFPGDGVADVNNTPVVAYGTLASRISSYFGEVDVDASIAAPPGSNRTTDYRYNAPDYNRVGQQALGRVVEFNYATLRGWDGDLDRDGVRGEAVDDKFPVSCRVFSNFTAYNSYVPAAGSAPVAGRAWPNNHPAPATYVTGGCYAVDSGLPALDIVVSDDGIAGNDPHTTVTYVSGTTWNVSLFFRVTNSSSPFTVEFNPNHPNPGTIQTITPLVTPDVLGDGLKAVINLPVTISPFTGPTPRTLAVRATDGAGTSPWFFWATQTEFRLPALFEDNFDGASLNTTTKWFPVGSGSSNLNGSDFNQFNTPYTTYTMWSGGGQAGTPNFMQQHYVSLNGGAGNFLRLLNPASTTPLGTATASWTTLQSRNQAATPGTVYNVSFKTNGGGWGSGVTFMIGAAYSFDGGATWTIPSVTTPASSSFTFTAGTVPPPLPAGLTTGTGWSPVWNFIANPAGGRGGCVQGWGTAVRDGFVNIDFGVGNAFTGDYDYVGWETCSFNTVAAPAGSPQFRLLLYYYRNNNGGIQAPGPAFDDVFVN